MRAISTRALFDDFDLAAMKEKTQPFEFFSAWIYLPDAQRNEMGAKFRGIFEIACEKDYRAILDKAQWHLHERGCARGLR